MRREMLEALSFPRMLILRLIDERDCPHKNLFEATSERCGQCDINRECHWVSCLNEFSDFEDKPTHTINASLRYGVKLIESHFDGSLHRNGACDCEHCDWLRHARSLIEQFELTLPENPYRPPHQGNSA